MWMTLVHLVFAAFVANPNLDIRVAAQDLNTGEPLAFTPNLYFNWTFKPTDGVVKYHPSITEGPNVPYTWQTSGGQRSIVTPDGGIPLPAFYNHSDGTIDTPYLYLQLPMRHFWAYGNANTHGKLGLLMKDGVAPIRTSAEPSGGVLFSASGDMGMKLSLPMLQIVSPDSTLYLNNFTVEMGVKTQAPSFDQMVVREEFFVTNGSLNPFFTYEGTWSQTSQGQYQVAELVGNTHVRGYIPKGTSMVVVRGTSSNIFSAPWINVQPWLYDNKTLIGMFPARSPELELVTYYLMVLDPEVDGRTINIYNDPKSPPTNLHSVQFYMHDWSEAAVNPKKKTPVGAIAGGVAGGVALLVGIVVVALLLRRRRKATTTERPGLIDIDDDKPIFQPGPSSAAPVPYVVSPQGTGSAEPNVTMTTWLPVPQQNETRGQHDPEAPLTKTMQADRSARGYTVTEPTTPSLSTAGPSSTGGPSSDPLSASTATRKLDPQASTPIRSPADVREEEDAGSIHDEPQAMEEEVLPPAYNPDWQSRRQQQPQ